MCDSRTEHINRAAVGDQRIPYATETWQYGQYILTECTISYQWETAAQPVLLRCIVCDNAIAFRLFVIMTLITHDQCDQFAPHLYSDTVARHLSCQMPDGDAAANMIAAKLTACHAAR